MKILLSPNELSLVATVLTKNLSREVKVYVFGSRARGDAKKFSDLDLAIDYAGQRLPISIQAELADDFDDSDLPFKVDIVDLNGISDTFKMHIAKDLIALDYAEL